MTEPIRFRQVPSPLDTGDQSGPSCMPGRKPEPWLLPEYLFDTDDEQTEPQSDKTESTPDTSPDEKPADHDQ
ncbi:hypothetical protein CQR46_0946 [Bifidobacterium pseudolongum subsp. globosum]|uniref:Uncharacterized protein n=1 Tax=Bifidobacterium pseudolongum subsp. globosum TaxID=1690 RepID=A0A2N3QHM2_9BIFI|nr:hypothetical protein CQR46_0946 [Bifidobacterium pseudolongum subsp. globosum]